MASLPRTGPVARLCTGTITLCLLLTSACSALNLGASQPVTWFSLEDLRDRLKTPGQSPAIDAASSVASKTNAQIDRVLLIGPVQASPFYDSTQLPYSRSDIARAYYQYAAWTERPAKRLALLVERRLSRDSKFLAVTSSTSGIRGGLILNLFLDEIYHDTMSRPEMARLRIRAQLIDWRQRTLISQQSFTSSAKVITPDAASAVRAMSHATSTFLDELSEWITTHSQPQ